MSVHAQHHWHVPQLPEERLEMAAKLARENLDGNHSRIQKLVEEWHPELDCVCCDALASDLEVAEQRVRALRDQVAKLESTRDAGKLAHEGKECKR